MLDIFGPLTKIFEIAESAKALGQTIDPHELSRWTQRAICTAGNVNTSLAIERRKTILCMVDPKLSNLSVTEAGEEVDGLLFGNYFRQGPGAICGHLHHPGKDTGLYEKSVPLLDLQ